MSKSQILLPDWAYHRADTKPPLLQERRRKLVSEMGTKHTQPTQAARQHGHTLRPLTWWPRDSLMPGSARAGSALLHVQYGLDFNQKIICLSYFQMTDNVQWNASLAQPYSRADQGTASIYCGMAECKRNILCPARAPRGNVCQRAS